MGSDNLKQCLNMDSEEIITQTDDSDLPSNDFNTIIGYIEDIVISDSFQVRHWHIDLELNLQLNQFHYYLFLKEIQTNFLDLHCMEFTNEEENKIIYMQIFNDYTKLIENFILDNLQRIAPHIDMIAFLTELR